MSSLLPTRKRIRLAPEVYQGPAAFSVVISTAQRFALFHNGRAIQMCVSALEKTSPRHSMVVLVYFFMPDHLHLLLEGGEGSNLIRFMKTFKQVSAYCYRQAFKQSLWQKGYYDHVLRKDEDMRTVAEYIFYNPVRAGLVESAWEYPFCGGSLLTALRAT